MFHQAELPAFSVTGEAGCLLVATGNVTANTKASHPSTYISPSEALMTCDSQQNLPG